MSLSPWARRGLSICLYTLLSIAWSWPLSSAPFSTVVSGLDSWGTIWLISVSDSVTLTGQSTAGSWPFVQDLGRSDSVLMMVLLRLWPGQPNPVAVLSALVLFGPVVSALATEFCAERCLRAQWPWSIAAGISAGFLGIASATFVDGQVYALLNPWLPLLAWAWWQAAEQDGRAWHGVLAGVFWFLCLLTTAYVGIAATLLVLIGFLRLPKGRAILAAAATAVPLGLAFVWRFTQGELRTQVSPFADQTPQMTLELGSTHLSSLAGWVHKLEAAEYSVVAPLGMVILALVAAAPLVLERRGSWLWWAGLGILGVLLSFGPTLRLAPSNLQGLPWIWRPIMNDQVAALYRFPARMLWVTGPAFGVIAAAVLTRLSQRLNPWLLAPLMLGLAVEAILLTGNAWRSDPVPAVIPLAYAHAPPGPVLDLYPQTAGPPVDYELYMMDLSCTWAGQHGRPVAQRCLETTPNVDPRAKLSAELHHQALSGEPPERSAQMLSELGFAAVIWRPDAYVINERQAVRQSLEQGLGAPLFEGWDGGEHLLVYGVPSAPKGAPVPTQAWTQWID